MKLVKDIFKLRRGAATKGDLGVEIEVEGENLPHTQTYWRMDHDGSLRGEAIEYVFDKPRSLKGTKEALDYLHKKFVAQNSTFHETVRAGVHVHVNAQELTIVQLYNFLTLYMLLEELLVSWCGPSREGNLFCLRTCDAEFLLDCLKESARSRDVSLLNTDDLRYASMNVRALFSYGSVEFRAMRSTPDFDLVYKWAEILLGLREVAKEFEDPTHIISTFSEQGPVPFVNAVIKDAGVLEGVDDWDGKLFSGMRNAQDLAYCTNWTAKEKPKVNPFKVSESLWV